LGNVRPLQGQPVWPRHGPQALGLMSRDGDAGHHCRELQRSRKLPVPAMAMGCGPRRVGVGGGSLPTDETRPARASRPLPLAYLSRRAEPSRDDPIRQAPARVPQRERSRSKSAARGPHDNPAAPTVGLVIEKVSGVRISNEFVRRRMPAPLGLHRTSLIEGLETGGNVASPHVLLNHGTRRPVPRAPRSSSGPGGGNSPGWRSRASQGRSSSGEGGCWRLAALRTKTKLRRVLSDLGLQPAHHGRLPGCGWIKASTTYV